MRCVLPILYARFGVGRKARAGGTRVVSRGRVAGALSLFLSRHAGENARRCCGMNPSPQNSAGLSHAKDAKTAKDNLLESPSRPPRPLHEVNSFLRQWNGPLTRDLVLHPGDFGLGQIPARLKPDAITRSVCGFCSTGCSLDIHLKNGVAVNLSPTNNYPVNLGMACPKGWESLAPLDAADRGTTPLIRRADGKLSAASLDDAMRLFTEK